MIENGYLSLADLKTALGDTGTERDALYERAIEAASRKIDGWCGRHFWLAPAASARLFRPMTRYLVWTGDFDDATAVTVEVDQVGDGVFTALAADHWQPGPFVRYNGHPYDRVLATSGDQPFPMEGLRPRVRVTAQWGWPELPAEVVQAAQILAIAYYKSKDLTGGEFGFDDQERGTGPIQIARSLVEEFAPKTPGGDRGTAA